MDPIKNPLELEEEIIEELENVSEREIFHGEYNSEYPIYSTTEAGAQVGISADMVRYHVKNNPDLFPGIAYRRTNNKNRQGNMMLSQEHIDTLREIVALKNSNYSDNLIREKLAQSSYDQSGSRQIHPDTAKALMNYDDMKALMRASFESGAEYAMQELAEKYFKNRDQGLLLAVQSLQQSLTNMLTDKEAEAAKEKDAELKQLNEQLSESKEETKALSQKLKESNDLIVNAQATLDELRAQNEKLQRDLEEAQKKKGFFSKLFG